MYFAVEKKIKKIKKNKKVSVHLAKRFQRRRLKCEKLTDDRHQVTASDGKRSHCL